MPNYKDSILATKFASFLEEIKPKYLSERKIVKIFLSISLMNVLGVQKNHLIEMVLLSTHNICCVIKPIF